MTAQTHAPPPASPTRTYILFTVISMSVYIALNMAAIFGAFDALKAPGRWALAALVATPIIVHIWAFVMLIERSDEFVSAIFAKRFIYAVGIALSIAAAWGFAESYADAPHVPAWMVYPLVWAAFGLVTPFVRTSR